MQERDYAIQSRRRTFEQEIKQLRRIMQGGNIHVWPFMTDFWGDYSEGQTNIFVNEIVKEERYREIHTSGYEQPQNAADKLSFYRNILYCVLRALTSGYTGYESGNIIGCRKPEDVLFSDVVDSFKGEDGELIDSFTVCYVGAVYEIVSGSGIDLSCLNFCMVEEELTEDVMCQLLEEAESWEEEEEAWAIKHGFDIEELREFDRREEERQQECARQDQERLREEFANPEHFCRSLEAVLEYLKEHAEDAAGMREEIEELLFGFLSYRSLTAFDDEKAYVETMVQLKKAIRTAQKYGEE